DTSSRSTHPRTTTRRRRRERARSGGPPIEPLNRLVAPASIPRPARPGSRSTGQEEIRAGTHTTNVPSFLHSRRRGPRTLAGTPSPRSRGGTGGVSLGGIRRAGSGRARPAGDDTQVRDRDRPAPRHDAPLPALELQA